MIRSCMSTQVNIHKSLLIKSIVAPCTSGDLMRKRQISQNSLSDYLYWIKDNLNSEEQGRVVIVDNFCLNILVLLPLVLYYDVAFLTLNIAWVVPVTVMTLSGQDPSLMCIFAPLSSLMAWMISPFLPMMGPTSLPVVRHLRVRLTLGTSPGSWNSVITALESSLDTG